VALHLRRVELRTRLQRGRNLALALVGGRWHGNDGHSQSVDTLRRSTNEVHLSAESGVETVADRVGANLTSQVHLNAAVNGSHAGLLLHNAGVVHIVDGQHL